MGSVPEKAPNFNSEKVRRALTEAFFNLTKLWELTRQEEARLLGWDYAEKRSTLDYMRKGKTVLDKDQDKLERVMDLVNVHKSLRILFPNASSRQEVYDWIKVNRERFGGYSALDIMLEEGKEGIAAIRNYLEFERTR
ncbi:MAG: hypothetical protein HY538_02355 [Deltaproteobacteria bacterium]|nr:hypothetical protein [Deltaproteobacteria bacterium]